MAHLRNFNRFTRSPMLEVTLYVIGMLLIIFGFGCLIVSIDPKPFPQSSWISILVIGLIFIASGSPMLLLVVKLKPNSKMFSQNLPSINVTDCSAADLLSETLYEEQNSPPVAYNNTEASLESVKTVNQCMMTKPNSSTSNPIFFYKETFV